MVSILLCTIDRYDLTVQCIGNALANSSVDFELLVTDNGSKDQRVIDFIRTLQPVYHRVNKTNLGCAPMLNQMMLRAKGDYICIMDNDIAMPDNWLGALVDCNAAIGERAGVSGVHCVMDLPEPQVIDGVLVHLSEGVFGTRFWHRRLLTKLGYLCEDYAPYGLDDRDWNFRCWQSGLLNYYVGNIHSKHLGNDVAETTPYRQMKWDSIQRASLLCDANFRKYQETCNYYLPPPPLDGIV